MQVLGTTGQGRRDLVPAAFLQLLRDRLQRAEGEDHAGEIVERDTVEVDGVLEGTVADRQTGDVFGAGSPARALLPDGVGEAHEVRVDDVRVQFTDVRLRQTELVEGAVLVGVRDDVGLLDELLALRELLRVVEVELDGVLAGPAVELEHGLFLVEEVSAADHEDVGAVLGEDSGAGGTCDDVRKVKDLDAGQRAFLAGLAVLFLLAAAELLGGDERHGADGLADFGGFPLIAGADHAAAGTVLEGQFLEVDGVLLFADLRDLLAVFADGEHVVFLGRLLRRQGRDEFALLVLVVDVEGDLAAVLGRVLVEGAVPGVVDADGGLETGQFEPEAGVVCHVQTDGLETGERDVAGGFGVLDVVAAQAADLSGDGAAGGQDRGDGRSLKDLLFFEELVHRRFPFSDEHDAEGARERILFFDLLLELFLAVIVGDEGGRDGLDVLAIHEVFKDDLRLLRFRQQRGLRVLGHMRFPPDKSFRFYICQLFDNFH